MDKQRKKIHYKFPPYGVFYLLTNLSSPYDKCLVGTKNMFFWKMCLFYYFSVGVSGMLTKE